MANIYKTRDRDAKIITQYLPAAQTTSSTTALSVTFNPTHVRGRVNEPYAIQGALFFDASASSTEDCTLTFDAGAGSLAIDATMSGATAVDTGTGTNVLTTSAVTLLIDASAITSASGLCIQLAGIWIPSLRDTVTLSIASSGATTFTIQKGSWLKYTRLSD